MVLLRMIKYTLCIFLCAILLVPNIKCEKAYAYNDGYTLIGDVSIPFAEYMPGTYFTKNGQACVCHANSAVDCVANGVYCNCTRYVNIDGVQVDLLAVQCIGFARYCFYRLFGFIDHPQLNPDLYYNAGTLSYGQVTEAAVKQLFSKLKPGAHIRFKLASSQHSVILLSQNENGFTVYQCNSGGNGIPQASCIVSTKTYTWLSFANYAYRGIVHANMPCNYPERLEYSQTPYEPTNRTDGIYTTTTNLRLRERASTESAWLDTISTGTQIYVAEINGEWGRVIYNGKVGYISLAYTYYTKQAPQLASDTEGVYAKNGYVFGLPVGVKAEDLGKLFSNEGISCDIADNESIKTGAIINITEGESVVYSAIIVLSGDVNGDGLVSTADCAALQGILMGDATKAHFLYAADVNGDSMQSTTDYKKLKLVLKNKTQEGA